MCGAFVADYQERPARHAARPLSGPNAHPYLWMLERLTAGTLTLDQIPPQDMAIVEYAIRSRAEQAKNRHKRGGSKGGRTRKRSAPARRDWLAGLVEPIVQQAQRVISWRKSVGAQVNFVWRKYHLSLRDRSWLRREVYRKIAPAAVWDMRV